MSIQEKNKTHEKVIVPLAEGNTVEAVRTSVTLEETQTIIETEEQLNQLKANLQAKITEIDEKLAILKPVVVPETAGGE